jgi:hypothetical protein
LPASQDFRPARDRFRACDELHVAELSQQREEKPDGHH